MRIIRKNQCQKVQGLLSPYIDGQIGSSERDRVESHLDECQLCRRELESLRATVNLLHRVAIVSPSRSFVLTEIEAKRRPATLNREAPQWRRLPALGALRVATAVTALLLVFVLAGDATNLFEAGPVEDRAALQGTPVADEVQGTPVPDEVVGVGGASFDSEGFTDGEGYIWPVLELELALTGVVLILGGATAVLWDRKRRGLGKG
ncbi:MAG: zf-HC2 domain-containing protein [Dehalococcoidia bacterium]|nr:zf-HC2 domain-containing protein [Dehalococcoidia bacterium]